MYTEMKNIFYILTFVLNELRLLNLKLTIDNFNVIHVCYHSVSQCIVLWKHKDKTLLEYLNTLYLHQGRVLSTKASMFLQ